jgi:hypothetical protein
VWRPWQAPDTYITMSPFMQADKIKKPLLLIHGEDDNNPGQAHWSTHLLPYRSAPLSQGAHCSPVAVLPEDHCHSHG